MDLSFKSTESASILDAARGLMTTYDETLDQTIHVGKTKTNFRSKIPRWVGKSTKKKNIRQRVNAMAELFDGNQDVKQFLYDMTRLNFKMMSVSTTKRIRTTKIIITLQN